MKEISLVHVLPGLTMGGAEYIVLGLAKAQRALGMDISVLSLHGAGPLLEEFRKSGIPVHFPGTVTKSTPRPNFWHGWLYSGNLYAGWQGRCRNRSRVIWGLMQANVSPSVNSFKTRLLMKVGAHFSRSWPDAIVCNSESARVAHEEIGFDRSKMRVIGNGIDTEKFSPDALARERLCREVGLDSSEILIGHLARWDPQKDHHTLIQAAGRLLRQGVKAHFLLAGPGVDPANRTIMGWVQSMGFPGKIHLLGPRADVPNFLRGLDILAQSSVGESSSCALQEAMACGVPVVATDVGDTRDVVGDAGIVVSPRNPEALANGFRRLIEEGQDARHRRGEQGRAIIVQRYSFNDMVEAYQSLYAEIDQNKDRAK